MEQSDRETLVTLQERLKNTSEKLSSFSDVLKDFDKKRDALSKDVNALELRIEGLSKDIDRLIFGQGDLSAAKDKSLTDVSQLRLDFEQFKTATKASVRTFLIVFSIISGLIQVLIATVTIIYTLHGSPKG